MLRISALLATISAHLLISSTVWADGADFRITLDPAASQAPVDGRLIISIIRPGAKLGRDEDPNNSPFWGDPQPMFGQDVAGLAPAASLVLEKSADHSFESAATLKPGVYRAAARLITSRTRSSWREDPGNLYSDPVEFTITADSVAEVALNLSHCTTARTWPGPEAANGAELVEIRSKLLSDFRGREVMLRAGVVPPAGYGEGSHDSTRKYAAVYEIPGFGGDHFGALDIAKRRARASTRAATGDASALNAQVFWIVLDPESPNGHTLFADSANNGPCGRALVEELIPALEKRYPLASRPEARLLRGHSSGGWSTLWLALNYPQNFAATWSSSPDPVDFRRFQLVDIYARENIYINPPGTPTNPASKPVNPDPAAWPDTPSFRQGREVQMTIRQEARCEDLLGPDNTSGQQWDSWFAVFGPKNAAGQPAALFDPATGLIDRAVAEHYRRFDIGHLLRTQPKTYVPLVRSNARIIVGDTDNFYLNEAVALLKDDLEKLDPRTGESAAQPGYIKIVPGADHSSIFGSAEIRNIPTEMLKHLRAHGLTAAENR